MIGCLGTRSDILLNELEELNLESCGLSSQDEINSDLDLVLASGVHYKINKKLLYVPKHGIVGFHESDLPFGAGCAPLAWTLILGLDHMTVTMFRFVEQFDKGPIIAKKTRMIDDYNNIHHLEKYRNISIASLIKDCVPRMLDGKGLYYQQTGEKVHFPRRFPSDSTINEDAAKQSVGILWKRHIRACHNKNYPCTYKDKNVLYTGGRDENHVPPSMPFNSLKFPCSFTVSSRDITLYHE